MRLLGLAISVALFVPTAEADSSNSNDSGDGPLAVGVGVSFAVMSLEDREICGMLARAELGHAVGSFEFVGALALGYGVDATSSGGLARLGVSARLLLASHREGSSSQVGVLELGVGWQRLPAPVAVTRTDGLFGVNWEIRERGATIGFGLHVLLAMEPVDQAVPVSATGRARRKLDTGLISTYQVRW